MIGLFIETDIYADVDDVGALAVALTLQARGECEVLGIGVNTPSRWGAGAARAVLARHGVDAPVGRLAEVTDDRHERDYASLIAVDGDDSPLATDLLVETLRAASEPVVIVSVGFMPNLLQVVREHPDVVSDGVARLVLMGGLFPEGREFNVSTYPQQTAELLQLWPTPVDLVGFEAADDVITGADLADRLAPEDPVRVAYEAYCGVGVGRPSWDLVTVLLAVRPGWDAFTWSEPGELVMEGEVGRWEPRADGRHRHAVRRVDAEAVRAVVDPLLDAPDLSRS